MVPHPGATPVVGFHLDQGFVLRINVAISDARISRDVNDEIVTHSLGSCIGVACYDPATHVGGLLHYQLPSARNREAKAANNPLMFADTGMQYVINKMIELGAEKGRIQIKIAGGAQVMSRESMFQIGKRNYASLRQVLWKNGMFIAAEDVGGEAPRNLSLRLSDGRVEVKSQGISREL